MKMHAIHPNRHQGAALLLLVLALCIAFTTLLIASMGGRNALQARADKTTLEALRDAKEALINQAIAVNGSQLFSNVDRPGELPCPDRNAPGSADEGTAGLAGISSCSGNPQLFRRLPWRTLGLTNYKDGAGETLWYMVATPFEGQPNTAPINSATPGSLQAFADTGRIALTTLANRAVAIIFAPGAMLAGQNRSSSAQQASPANYLESVAPPNTTAAFGNASTNPATPRITGPIKDAAGNIVLNDQLVIITHDDIMTRVRQRAAREYPLAIIARSTPQPACMIGAHPPKIDPDPGATDNYNWLGFNGWENVLTYISCPQRTLQ